MDDLKNSRNVPIFKNILMPEVTIRSPSKPFGVPAENQQIPAKQDSVLRFKTRIGPEWYFSLSPSRMTQIGSKAME